MDLSLCKKFIQKGNAFFPIGLQIVRASSDERLTGTQQAADTMLVNKPESQGPESAETGVKILRVSRKRLT